MYTIDQVADSLHLSYQKAYRMVRKGEIKAQQFGSAWRIPQAEYDRLMMIEEAINEPFVVIDNRDKTADGFYWDGSILDAGVGAIPFAVYITLCRDPEMSSKNVAATLRLSVKSVNAAKKKLAKIGFLPEKANP